MIPRQGGGGQLCSSLQHGVQLVCQVVEHAADIVQDADRALVLGPLSCRGNREGCVRAWTGLYLSPLKTSNRNSL